MKTKRQKLFIWLLIVSMFAMYGFLPIAPYANAIDSISNAKDTLSDSDAGVTATHTFTFTTASTTPAGSTWLISFPVGFDLTGATALAGYGDVNMVETVQAGARTVTVTMTGAQIGTSTAVVVSGVISPLAGSEGSYTISIANRNGTVVMERVNVMVQIIQDVLMTATVSSILNFTISGVVAGAQTVNGVACDNTTTATATPFGTLLVNVASTVCQTLNVTTNADDGYTVTVQQDDELTSDSGSNINSFNNSPDSTGSTTAQAWAVPLNTLDQYNTYGHMGLTSDDQDLASTTIGGYANQDYYNGGGAAHFAGLNNTVAIPVMHHDGPADGTTQNKGLTHVLYRIQIASLQEAGDYENTLTYIATPQF